MAKVIKMDRRKEDPRVTRLEEKVDLVQNNLSQLIAIVTNGLTDRTKRTDKTVEEQAKRTDEIDSTLKTFLATEEVKQKALETSQQAMTKAVDSLRKELNKWNKWVIGILLAALAALFSALIWVLIHSQDISKVLQTITKALGE